ncbi:amylo-alpha-1,6-glucosidase [Paenibacillus sp. strain BS8-2]
MVNLQGPGIGISFNEDPGHNGWIPHPLASVPEVLDSPVRLLERQFLTSEIQSKYEINGQLIRQRHTVLHNKVACMMEMSAGLNHSLPMLGHTLGCSQVRVLHNGIEVTEAAKQHKPMMYRIRMNLWEGTRQFDPVIRVGGEEVLCSNRKWFQDITDYAFDIPSNTTRVELFFEFSRNAFEADPAGVGDGELMYRCSWIDEAEGRIVDAFEEEAASQSGTLSELYLDKALQAWEKLERQLPSIHMPDQSLESFASFTFINQQMCEILPEGLISYPAMMAKQTFWGFWMWDYAFHAVASRWIEGHRLAKGSMLNMANMQWDNGCITNSAQPYGVNVFLEEHGSKRQNLHISLVPDDAIGGTHPPAFGFAVKKLLESTGSLSFAEGLLPYLCKYNAWFQQNQIEAEYPDLIVVRKWSDSGQDNAKRWGNRIYTLFGDAEPCWWDFPIIGVDINVLWVEQNEVIGELYKQLGQQEEGNRYLEQARRTREAIQRELWNEEEGFYFDLHVKTGKHIPVYSPAGFFPLYIQLVTSKQYERLNEHLLDENRFWTRFPLPTLSADDADFNPAYSYWRGPVWFYFNYFVTEGLYHYDSDVGDMLFHKTIDLMTHKGFVTAYENYNPLTGDGYNAAHFLWGGLMASTLIERICGITPTKEGVLVLDPKHIPADWGGFSLDRLPILGGIVSVSFERNAEGAAFVVNCTRREPLQVELQGVRYVLAMDEPMKLQING